MTFSGFASFPFTVDGSSETIENPRETPETHIGQHTAKSRTRFLILFINQMVATIQGTMPSTNWSDNLPITSVDESNVNIPNFVSYSEGEEKLIAR
jgi:hypothetical protein